MEKVPNPGSTLDNTYYPLLCWFQEFILVLPLEICGEEGEWVDSCVLRTLSKTFQTRSPAMTRSGWDTQISHDRHIYKYLFKLSYDKYQIFLNNKKTRLNLKTIVVSQKLCHVHALVSTATRTGFCTFHY